MMVPRTTPCLHSHKDSAWSTRRRAASRSTYPRSLTLQTQHHSATGQDNAAPAIVLAHRQHIDGFKRHGQAKAEQTLASLTYSKMTPLMYQDSQSMRFLGT